MIGGESGHMKRSPLAHEGVFNDEDFANKYAKRHKKMAEKFGQEYSGNLEAVDPGRDQSIRNLSAPYLFSKGACGRPFRIPPAPGPAIGLIY